MKIIWKIRQNTRTSMLMESWVDGVLIAYTSFNIPESIVWGVGAVDSEKIAEKISKRIKVEQVI